MLVHIFISGKVQGVFFRAFIKEKADWLGLAGWVRNTDNGQVEAVFEGSQDKIDKMIKCCWQGPAGSQVEKVEEKKVEEGKRVGTGEGFAIKY